MTAITKEQAIARVLSEAAAESSAALAMCPNALGLVMYYRIRMCALQHVRAILAYTPPSDDAEIIHPNIAGPKQ